VNSSFLYLDGQGNVDANCRLDYQDSWITVGVYLVDVMPRSPSEKSITHRQFNNPPNPADAADGPQLYDSHLYFAYVTATQRVIITDGTEGFFPDSGYLIILVHSTLTFSLLQTQGRRQPGSGIVPVHHLQ